ncbi:MULTISPECIES: Na+/H+ antiporter NhaC family protein [Clostridium]|uniref:Malate-2H(+)/Na(+)-lactate antiporter n=3 Tax=Clostridium TaxID=1485 RepID=D8GT71_CLOLD|nr:MULTISPECIES: Na+/H+ antiporter NhaC family protein [Clostridium]ADK16670.1 predicted Na+/H+ antiporter [Clostridium ljungdahlii DSM 13528]AGY75760.1 Na+/H+ antiporter NhaC family protein [Clostridium autoethanogenum DSM 10061]ALU35924.1 Na(+)/H(+) antiporter NhaC-like protein [Clostridium autoethanogenum DSM 10061]OAA89461.1 Malate-2H(+)/Na(+)-lactate antiporter [Clostridium ljungdahlii DSM 13528]OVY52017.1 Malate-2H(+)/Na(+)-lactate antiporter [Clostridium autoethanogenum]
MNQRKGSAIALLPLGIFMVLFLGVSIIMKDFYKMPVVVALIIASTIAILQNKKIPVELKVERFCRGAGDSSIILMCLIFILAGAFAEVSKAMGAVDSTVNLGLAVLPHSFIVAGIFIIGSFISMSLGTSVGTIVTLAPIAVGIAQKTGLPVEFLIAAVVSGAMFGDGLSMISNSTVAATKTQDCEMVDKFKANFKIVLPAAIITLLIYAFLTFGMQVNHTGVYNYQFIKILPYIAVLVVALTGFNVVLVLVGGIVLASIIGLIYGSFNIFMVFQLCAKGIAGMEDISIISILIGGIGELIKFNGGIDFLLNTIQKRIHSEKGAEFGIGILVSLVNLCTANNTVSIIIVGSLAKDLSENYGVDRRKTASLLDTFACFIQGCIPYGAQLLVASSLATISPFLIMKYICYPYLLGIASVLAIIIGIPKFKTPAKGALKLEEEDSSARVGLVK